LAPLAGSYGNGFDAPTYNPTLMDKDGFSPPLVMAGVSLDRLDRLLPKHHY